MGNKGRRDVTYMQVVFRVVEVFAKGKEIFGVVQGKEVVQWSGFEYANLGSQVPFSNIHWPLVIIWYYC